MASVDWQKMKSGSQKSAILRHCLREHKNYSNGNVNLSKSGKNQLFINPEIQFNSKYNQTGFFKKDKITAKSELERLNARVKELDAIKPPKRVRKDRVTAVAFNVPLPEGITDRKQAEEFFADTYKMITNLCGGDKNVSVGIAHFDEIHDYYDSSKDEFATSRPHLHIMGIPWTDERGVNCKNFMTRKSMKDLNRQIDSYCREKFKKPYLTQTGQISRGTVEDLKRDSRTTGLLAQELGIMGDFVKSRNLEKEYLKFKKDLLDKSKAQRRGEDLER